MVQLFPIQTFGHLILILCLRGRWNRETWHREIWQRGYRKGGHRETGQRGTRLNRSQRVEHPSAQEKLELAERWANELNPVFHHSTAALIVACSFCVQSAILSALIRSPYSRGSTTEVTATTARTKTRTGMALAVPAAPPSGASESATAAAATTSDECCKVCIVAPRAGFVDSIQDDAVMTKKTFRNWSISQAHNQSLFYSAPKRCPESWPT